MTLRALLDEATQRLEQSGVETPRVDAEWLLAHVLNIPRLELGLIDEINDDNRGVFEALISRRATREPLQHIIGSAAFRHLTLVVGPGVFVPRPETELLAGWVIDAAKYLDQPIIVDLGTGSGAIAAAIASEVPQARVFAIEIDPAAFDYAERNLAPFDVELVLGDLVQAYPHLNGTVDIVVSNPPYIPLEAWESVAIEARDFDPHTALFSGADGLDAIRAIETAAARLLKPGGRVAFEHADVQGASAPQIFTETRRWTQVRDHVDLADKPRFVTAIRMAV